MDNFKNARKLAKNFGSSTLNGALARAEEATAKADALAQAAIQARQEGNFKQAVDLFMTSASEYFIARDELVRASAVNGAERKQWLKLAGEMFMLSQETTEQANDLANNIAGDREIIATLPDSFESTWVMKGGEGSGRYPKGSGEGETPTAYKYQRIYDSIAQSTGLPTIEVEYKGDEVAQYNFISDEQPLSLKPDGEVSVPDIVVAYSFVDGDGWNSPRYADAETEFTASFSIQDEIGSIMEDISNHSITQREGLYLVTRESRIAGYTDFSLSPDGSPANAPKEIEPQTIVYGTSPKGNRQKICNVAQALSLATNQDVSPNDPWVWQFAQEQFDNQKSNYDY